MSGKKRRNFNPQEKVRLIRLHLIEKHEISKICEEHNIQPTQFHRWLKEFFERGHLAFEPQNGSEDKMKTKKIDHLEKKLQQKDSVIAELMEAHLRLKKVFTDKRHSSFMK